MTFADPSDKFLSIDIGGSKIKATILNPAGEMLMEYQKIQTPSIANPENVLHAIGELTRNFAAFTKVSVGFPGYVRQGVVHTAPNLAKDAWQGIDLGKLISDFLGKPARVLNDADMQGLGVAKGDGLEMVVTLGTGFGTALLMNGNLLPHLEVAHHPLSKDRDYDAYIGEAAKQDVGSERWNKRMRKVIEILKTVFNYDHLFIGGGNSKYLTFSMDDNITLFANIDGIKGGAKLWQSSNQYNV